MNFSELLSGGAELGARAARGVGVVVGVVTNRDDPNTLGRIKVKFPWLSDEDEGNWARVAAPMAGDACGVFFMPEVGDEVLVAFEHGDLRFPYVVGALWNGKDQPPAESMNVRVIKSRSGHVVRLTDEKDQEKIEIIDKTGKNSIVIDSSQNTLTITTDKDITLSAPQGTIRLDAQKVEIQSSADAKVEAGAGLDLKATGSLNVKGATVNIN